MTDQGAILTAVARLVAEATTFEAVVSGLADILRPEIPFERMHVLRLDRADFVTLYTAIAVGRLEVATHRITGPLGDDSTAGLKKGAASLLICSMRQGTRVPGALWFTSSHPGAFTATHQVLIDAAADLLTLAVHHEALRSTEALRRERIESLDRLLQTMAESLDIRMVFNEVSEVVRGGLPHDSMAMTS